MNFILGSAEVSKPSHAVVKAPAVPNPDTKDQDHVKPQQPVICAVCDHQITHCVEEIPVNGSSRHTFFNPHGIMFYVVCFGDAPGAGCVGPPSRYFSWFPGFSWRLVVCKNCSTHLGWNFQNLSGADFFSLIAKQLKGL